MLYLVKKIINHVLSQLDFVIPKKPDLSEVTVPSIHLVETSARHYVGVRQIKKPVLSYLLLVVRQLANLDLSEVCRRHP